jgi:hypothetical protein
MAPDPKVPEANRAFGVNIFADETNRVGGAGSIFYGFL